MPCFYVYDEYIAPCQEKVNETVATSTKSSGNNETIAQKLGVAEKKDTSVSGRMSGMFKGSNKVWSSTISEDQMVCIGRINLYISN